MKPAPKQRTLKTLERVISKAGIGSRTEARRVRMGPATSASMAS